jgi:hypothetical protein
MMCRRFCATAAILAAAMSLSGCGSGGEAPPPPPAAPSFVISAPQISSVLPETYTSGPFNVGTSFRIMPTASHFVDPQQNLLIHLTTFRLSNAPGPARDARMMTLTPSGAWSLGAISTTHPIVGALSTANGLTYISREGNSFFQSTVRQGDVQSVTVPLSGPENEVVVGPAAGGELIAARLVRDADTFSLETRKTVNGTWTTFDRQTVRLPDDFATTRVVNGVSFNYESHAIRGVVSGARGDVFHMALLGSKEPTNPVTPYYGGDYLLWRERGSNELVAIELYPVCQPSLSPKACQFHGQGGFQEVRLQANGEITYVTQEFNPITGVNDLLWKRSAKPPTTLLSSATTADLWGGNSATFVLASDGTQRGWTTMNFAEITLGESPSGTPLVPVAWTTAAGERVACSVSKGDRCRVFRDGSADRIAYFGWDEAARKAVIYVSDRTGVGAWKNVGTRDVSELIAGLDPNARISLDQFVGAGTSDIIVGTIYSGDPQQARKFAIRVSAKT